MKIQRYGWMRSLPRPVPDQYKFSASAAIVNAIAGPTVDLRDKCPPVYDQLNEGSCVGNGAVACVEFERLKQGLPDLRLSRQEVYNLGRHVEGNLASDSGMQVRTAMMVIRSDGIASESEYPYDETKITEMPPNRVIHDGLPNKAINYLSVLQDGTPTHIKHSLSLGFPVVFGFTVYESFESSAVAQSGDVPMPDITKEQVVGGHCMAIVGYDDSISKFIVRNSWSSAWGLAGYALMPYQYICSPDYADDLWSVRLVQ